MIKNLLPESLKQKLRRVEDYLRRYRLGHTESVILEDSYGIRFILPPHDRNPIRWQRNAGTNRQEFDTIARIVKEGDTVFDIGANIGLLSVWMAKQVGAQGRVYAFEPHPETRKLLKKTIALNEIENITIFPLALSSKTGSAQLYTVGTNHKLSSLGPISDTTYGENASLPIETVTLDSFCLEHHISQIDFLKIDVEGFEYDVLQGAERMLQNHAIKTIQFEMWKKNEDLIALLIKNGYEVENPDTTTLNFYAFIK